MAEMNEDLQTAIETITPQIAESYLELNKNVRKVTLGVVDKYADDMKNGRWKLSSETIAFDKHGNLKDGQHRLLACIKSGCPFKTIVVRGLEDGADAVIDIGKQRSAADQLKNVEYASKIASLTKLACATKKKGGNNSGIASFIYGKYGFEKSGKKTVNKTVSIPEQVEDAKANIQEYTFCLKQGNRLQKQFRKFSTTLYAYFVWLVRWLGEDDSLDGFISDICAILPESKTSSATCKAIFRKEDKTDKAWLISTLLYAYGAYRDGKEIDRIQNPSRCLDMWNKKISDKKKDDLYQEEDNG